LHFRTRKKVKRDVTCQLSRMQARRIKRNAHRIDDEVDELDPGRRLLALHDPDNGGVEKMASVVKDSSLGSLVLFRLWRDGDRV
jgi:hypothetical protein